VGLNRNRSREFEVRCGQVEHLFLMHAEETADPSTSPSARFTRSGSGRDDASWGELSGWDNTLRSELSTQHTLDFLDVLGLQAHADEASGEVLEAGNLCDDAKREWRVDRAGALKGAGEDAVGEDLHSLGVSHGTLAVVLDSLQIVYGGAAGEDGLGEDVGGGDCVLKGDVDADAADRRHRMGRVADAEQAGGAPVLKTVYLNRKELHFVP